MLAQLVAQLAPLTAPEQPCDGSNLASFESPAVLDDSVPLPVAPVVSPSDGGDQRVAPASGDPFFLGFAAGDYYPPPGELLDPLLLASLPARYDDGRPAAETYAFVMFDKRITAEREQELADLGVRVLAFHPHYTLKVALPLSALESVAALDFVRWVGVARPWQKVHPRLAQELQGAGDSALDVYIDVFDSDLGSASVPMSTPAPSLIRPGGAIESGPDSPRAATWRSNGWQQRALEAQGVEIVEYVDSIRAFRAHMLPAALEPLLALDFVQFVEPDLAPQVLHDESMPMILADQTRMSYDGDTNSAAVMGIADTGYYSAHYDLNGAWGVGWDLTNTTGPYVDGCGHGSHVLGTIRGEGDVDPSYRGCALGLGSAQNRRIFVARIFDDACGWSGAAIATILDKLDSSYFDGHTFTTRPHVINHSWGTPGTSWVGSEASPRTIDDEVWNYSQLQVWAAGNGGSAAGTINLEATAKNAFTVGSVVDLVDSGPVDPGTIAISSSRGPCGDGRWKPNIAAPGDAITSVGNSSPTAYATKSGTSMATPHVTGVAAQLCDHYSWLRYAPHQLASLMMATTLTKDDSVITTPSSANLDAYGAGRIEAYRAHWSTSQMNWTNSGWTQTSANWVYGDFTISTGCTRLVICMTYHEPQCSSGASHALVNDFDLWIDSPTNGIDPAGNTGEYFAQQSSVDNTEIRMINSPMVGAWRFKVWPDSVPSSARVSVTVVEIYADTTPDGTLTVSASANYVQPFQDVTINATVANPSYIASAVFLDSSSSADVLQHSSTTLADGAVTDLMGNAQSGRDVLLGDILAGSSRSAHWTTRWYNEGIQPWTVQARSDNWIDETHTVYVTVDGTPPTAVTNLVSTTHTPNVPSCHTQVDVIWTPATDALSGVAGYIGVWDTSPSTAPTGPVNIAANATSYSADLGSPALMYFHLRAIDNSGNLGAVRHLGPIVIDTNTVSTYCTGKTNSLGCVPSIGWLNQPSKSAGNFTVTCSNVLNHKNGLLFWGQTPTSFPFQGGIKCVASPTVRTVNISSGGSASGNDCSGAYAFTFDTAYMNLYSIDPGDPVRAQWWMRDPQSPSTTGLSDALKFTVCD
jgi:subtilisin family serine protease